MRFNPFPGLRPFESDEDHLFFGREPDIDALLARLRTARFVAVVGTSGSGKSSLVRSGLIPALESGFMAGAGSSWRIAVLRPGGDPIGHLADAASRPELLGGEDDGDAEMRETRRALLDATLRRGTRGLVNAITQARVPADQNVLILVDQFEEIFRYRRGRSASFRDESIAFVRLLLDATAQQKVPVYVVITMRSDFVGDCMDFPGLPEAVNSGLYLVGRMTRDALRSAITGPVAVAGGTIAPRLVSRVLNDLGDDQDQLPRVQHVLMRTWEHRAARDAGDAPMDIEDYEAIGTLQDALSRHAEEAFREASAEVGADTIERMFKALTDTHTDPRGIRRPTSVEDLAEITGATQEMVIKAVETFRRPPRSFLTPQSGTALSATSIIDISHESLMRCWERLIDWARQEADAADFYLRLSRAAAWFEAGKAGLWRQPELDLGERWQTESHPNAAWARRHDEGFARAMAFLDRSIETHRREVAEAERARKATLRRTQWTAAVLALLLVAAVGLAVVARRATTQASANLALARAAVDESLSSVDLDPSRLGADVPALEELRHDLLAKAQRFYTALAASASGGQEARHDLALAHLRLGHINRLLGQQDEAAREYADAIARLDALVAASPRTAAYQEELADANNWLGEVLRQRPSRFADARKAYDRAIELQRPLADADPGSVPRMRQLARSFYNRGILLSSVAAEGDASDADLREAIRRLNGIAGADPEAAGELARANNNLAGLISIRVPDSAEARTLYERAVALDEARIAQEPANREARLELATFCNNLAFWLHEHGDPAAADGRSRQAVALLDELARLAPSLAVERADARTLRAQMLATGDPAAAARTFAESVALFEELVADPRLRRMPQFQERFGDLLLDLAAFPAGRPGAETARTLLSRALEGYASALASVASAGSLEDARLALTNLTTVIAGLPPGPRSRLAGTEAELQRRIATGR